jgi:hypothetical protein
MTYYIIVHKETGKPCLEGSGIYPNLTGARKARTYWLKEKADHYEILAITSSLFRVLLEVQNQDSFE